MTLPPLAPELAGDPLPASPLPLLARWLEDARASDRVRNADAIALSTVDASGRPDARMVLCRGFDAERGTFTFYTDRGSAKGAQLEVNAHASAVFYWDALARQVRFSGRVISASEADSDAYFEGRHPDSKVGAWTSQQSRPIASRAELLARYESNLAKYAGTEVERPPYWGGYTIVTERIELWQEQPGRLHDRGLWTREADEVHDAALTQVPWTVQRLQP